MKIHNCFCVFASTQLRITRLRKYPIDPKAYLGHCSIGSPYMSWIKISNYYRKIIPNRHLLPVKFRNIFPNSKKTWFRQGLFTKGNSFKFESYKITTPCVHIPYDTLACEISLLSSNRYMIYGLWTRNFRLRGIHL